jgi:hypothetical protein
LKLQQSPSKTRTTALSILLVPRDITYYILSTHLYFHFLVSAHHPSSQSFFSYLWSHGSRWQIAVFGEGNCGAEGSFISSSSPEGLIVRLAWAMLSFRFHPPNLQNICVVLVGRGSSLFELHACWYSFFSARTHTHTHVFISERVCWLTQSALLFSSPSLQALPSAKIEKAEPESQLPEKYARMLKMGVPMSAIQHKMEQDGVEGGRGPSDQNAPGVSKPRCDYKTYHFLAVMRCLLYTHIYIYIYIYIILT